MRKRILSIMLTLCMALMLIPTTVFASENGVTDDGLQYIISDTGEVTITKYTGSASEITIPKEIEGKPVTSIGYMAFNGCGSLTSITIPDSVTSIGRYAFYYCSRLTSITIPDSVTSIGDDAFFNCQSLTSITIPDSVTSIGDYAFGNCRSLTSITIPNGITSIGVCAFYFCQSLTSISIPESVTSIGTQAFYGCQSLTSITIPENVTSIGHNAFDSCTGLTSINIPEGVASIENETFFRCTGLTSIAIPSSVTSIGERAFMNCYGLTSITIPESVTSIGSAAFGYCQSLTSIFIPGNLDVTGGWVPSMTSQIRYEVGTGKDEVTITEISLGDGQNSVDIPATISEYPVVAVADGYQGLVGTHTHTGGTATCQTKATCALCGGEYGELNTNNHTGTPGDWQKDANGHWRIYSCCLDTKGDEAAHSGGTATCKDKAKCTVCGGEYGGLDSTNHDLEKVPAKDATFNAAGNTEYWHCKDCEKYFSDKDGKNSINLKDTVIAKLTLEIIDGKGQSVKA